MMVLMSCQVYSQSADAWLERGSGKTQLQGPCAKVLRFLSFSNRVQLDAERRIHTVLKRR